MCEKKWVEVTAWVDARTRQSFKESFKGCQSRFVRSCMERALHDRHFFETMFFEKWRLEYEKGAE